MTQSTYLTHLQAANHEPPEATELLKQALWTKGWLAWMTEEDQQEARTEVRKLTAQWWRAVRG